MTSGRAFMVLCTTSAMLALSATAVAQFVQRSAQHAANFDISVHPPKRSEHLFDRTARTFIDTDRNELFSTAGPLQLCTVNPVRCLRLFLHRAVSATITLHADVATGYLFAPHEVRGTSCHWG